jgi:hypothetical protein
VQDLRPLAEAEQYFHSHNDQWAVALAAHGGPEP